MDQVHKYTYWQNGRQTIMTTVGFVGQQSLYFIMPLLILALGGLFSEKGGIINIALEGLMMSGAFTGILFIRYMQDTTNLDGQWLLVLALLVAGVTGAAVASLHAFATISLNADQVISGFAINMLIPGLTIVLARSIYGVLQVNFTNTFRVTEVGALAKIPVIGEIFFQRAYIITPIAIGIFIVGTIVLYRTKIGEHLQACGENPNAADSVGINVKRVRYFGVITSGFISGISGVMLVIPTATEYNPNVAGYGFLAYAIMVFGLWRPKNILIAAIFFGIMRTFASVYTGIDFFASLGLDSYVFKLIPFVLTLVILSITSKRGFGQPEALGQIFDQGRR
jgi:simple sugar transport system permease protein